VGKYSIPSGRVSTLPLFPPLQLSTNAMLIRLFQPVVFDGKTLQGVIETDGTAISANCIIQRGWGVESQPNKESKAIKPSKASQEPVPSDPPSEDPDQDESDESDELDEPQDEQPSEQPAEPPVVVEAPPKPTKPARRASRSQS
jgi:hypothetical protein